MAMIQVTEQTYQPYEEKMKATLRVLDDTLNSVRAGRANPRLLDGITVPYYGVDTPLAQVANVQVPEARLIQITPWDPKILKEINRSILGSDLGITPIDDGKTIRLVFPPLTEDRRKELTKEVSKMGEESKVAVRNIRREAMDTYKAHLKNKEMAEDDFYDFEDRIQKLTDQYVEKVEKAIDSKNKELLEV